MARKGEEGEGILEERRGKVRKEKGCWRKGEDWWGRVSKEQEGGSSEVANEDDANGGE